MHHLFKALLVMKADVQVKASMSSSPTSREKRVSFADLVGLKLEFVKTITPCSSEDNLCGVVGVWKDSCCDMNGNLLRMRRMICLKPCFIVPSRTEDFIERVQSQNVCLENIACENFVVTGVIRVKNLAYAKEVTVRYTLDDWDTFRDVWADYMSSCLDGKSDKFSFRITVPIDFEVNRFMNFAVRYRVLGQEFWDNNNGENYHVQCAEVLTEQFKRGLVGEKNCQSC